MNINTTGIPQPFPLKKVLPTTLSGWIYEAVKDARLLEKTPGFELNMYCFNSFEPDDDVCHVCLGGAAIVGCGLVAPGEGTGRRERASDDALSVDVAHALECVRMGDLTNAFSQLDILIPLDKYPEVNRIADELDTQFQKYCYNIGKGRAPWRAYIKAARELKAIGL